MLYLLASFLLLLVVPITAAGNKTDDDDNGSLLAEFNQVFLMSSLISATTIDIRVIRIIFSAA